MRAEPSSPWAPPDMGRASCGWNRPSSPETRDPAPAAIFDKDPCSAGREAERWAVEAGPQPQKKFLLGGAFQPQEPAHSPPGRLCPCQKGWSRGAGGRMRSAPPVCTPFSYRPHPGEAKRKRKFCGGDPGIRDGSFCWSPWTATEGSQHKPFYLKCHFHSSPFADPTLFFHGTRHNNSHHHYCLVSPDRI